jgi:hypothetical protein
MTSSPHRLKPAAGWLGLTAVLVLLCAILIVPQAARALPGRASRTPAATAPLILHRLTPGFSDQASSSGAPRAHAAASQTQPLSPAQIRAAYALPTQGATKQTIAIVSAFDDPTLQSDLAAYDRYFHLPPCTFANGCLRKLNQQGQTTPRPQTDAGGTWITESALGTEVAHSLCQSCRIVLVEADFPDLSDFSQAAHTAAEAGAGVVVTTFNPPEDSTDTYVASDYSSAHTAFVAATGDTGYSGSLSFPAAFPTVIAVGGTNLSLARGGSYGGETAWSGTVSGCSIYETAPPWQARIAKLSGCGSDRAASDVSAMASPGTIIYASNVNGTAGGALYQAEGTSVSAPIIGAIIGLAGSRGGQEAKMLYSRQLSDPGGFHDITKGDDAQGCKSAICMAGPGWDGPTGLGTPAGLEAFLPGGPAISPRQPRVRLLVPRRGVSVSSAGRLTLTLANGNPFRISGQLTLRRILRVRGCLRTLILATGKVGLTSMQRRVFRLSIRPSDRKLLRHRRLTVRVLTHVRGATGSWVTVNQLVTLDGA